MLLPLLSRCVGIPPPRGGQHLRGGGREEGWGSGRRLRDPRRSPPPPHTARPGRVGPRGGERGAPEKEQGESAEPCGTVREGSTGPSPAGGRSHPVRERSAAPPSGKAGATPPVYSPYTRVLRGLFPAGLWRTPVERNAPRRSGQGEAAAAQRQPVFP